MWWIRDLDFRKCVKYLKICKDNFWKWWKREYLLVLWECYNLIYKEVKFKFKVGDVVIIKIDNKNWGIWLLVIVSVIYFGKDGIICVVEFKIIYGIIEWFV